MPISTNRRHYLTFPDKYFKDDLKALASEKGQSLNEYLMSEIVLLSAIRERPIGQALIAEIQNGGKDVTGS